MDLRKISYFLAVVKHKNFSKAAEALHISQPSLSNAIKHLEQELNSPLIERTTRHFQLTDLGVAFYKRALDLTTAHQLMETELQELAKAEAIEIRMGMIESANFWFAQIMKDFYTYYPRISLTLVDTLYNQTVRQALLQFKVHAVITNQQIEDDEIKSYKLYSEPYVALIPNTHPLVLKKTLLLTDFLTEPLIIGVPNFQTSGQIIKAFHAQQLHPQIRYTIERFEMIKVLVEEQLGVAILPSYYVSRHVPETLTVRPIHDELLTRDVFLCTMAKRTFPKSVKKLFELIVNYHHTME